MNKFNVGEITKYLDLYPDEINGQFTRDSNCPCCQALMFAGESAQNSVHWIDCAVREIVRFCATRRPLTQTVGQILGEKNHG